MDLHNYEKQCYEFFKESGYVKEQLGTVWGVLRSRSKNNPLLDTECLKEYCDNKKETSPIAAQVHHLLESNPEGLTALLHGVTCEHIRSKIGAKSPSGVLHAIVDRVFKNSVKKENACLMLLSAALAKESPKVQEILNAHSTALVTFLSGRSAASQITEEKLSVLLTALEEYANRTHSDLSLFFSVITTPAGQKRLLEMLRQLKPGELPEAFESMVRVAKIISHEWTREPQHVRSDFALIRKIKEMPILQKSIFLGSQKTIWPNEHEEMRDREGVGAPDGFGNKIAVNQRELALLINERYLAQLRKAGGQELFLTSSDGDKIHTMEFNAEDFVAKVKETLSELTLLKEGTRANEKVADLEQPMKIYSLERPFSSNVQNLIDLGILVEKPANMALKECAPNEDVKDGTGSVLVMYPPIASTKEALLADQESTTAIICTGSGVWFGLYKSMIARLLLNGINVQAFSYRGYEHSEGIPTDTQLAEDVELVAHHLKEKGVKDEQILLYASCLGLGPAAHYVKNHPKTDIFIDRSFAKLSTVAVQVIEKGTVAKSKIIRHIAAKIAMVVLPKLVNFENLELLKNAEGKIALVTAETDDIVGEQKEVLKEGLSQATHISTQRGHVGNWLQEPSTLAHFEAFLAKSGHAKRVDFKF